MKILKPLRLSVMTRVYEVGSQAHLVVSAFAFFPLDDPRVLFSEQALWRTVAADLAGSAPPIAELTASSAPPATNMARSILDEGLPKKRGEVLVRGAAYPAGAPQPGCQVRLRVGESEAPIVDKSLKVSGDRRWEFSGMTMPEPFTRMPLDWEHAFGGPGYPKNPVGQGFAAAPGPDGQPLHLLPNIENPKDQVRAKGDRPEPGGFAPIDPSWQERTSKLGTFDQRWLERDYPGMPSDMELEAFSTAPRDQRIEGYWKGGERFALEHMHPTRPVLEGTLPALRARFFIARRRTGETTLHELSTRLDTIQFFPHLERGLLCFRGLAEVDEDDAWDVTHLMVAAERLDDPRSLQHYQAIYAKRLSPEDGALAAIVDVDLLPEIPPYLGADPDAEDIDQFIHREQLMEKNAARGARADHQRVLGEIAAAGLTPGEVGVSPTPPPEEIPAAPKRPEDVMLLVQETRKAEADREADAKKQREDAEEKARELCKKHGVDYDELIKSKETGGPPTFSAGAELDRVRSAVAEAEADGVPMPELRQRIDDPAYRAQLDEQERQLKEVYRAGAHLMPSAPRKSDDDARMLGGRVIAAQAGEVAMSDQDLTGAELAGADLRGIDLAMSFLERANLAGANLEGAKLGRAVLARANLRGANLRGADLRGANLGEAELDDASLEGADLTGAVLYHASTTRARFDGAKLNELQAWEVTLTDCSLARCEMTKTSFVHAKLVRVRATGAKLREVNFLESTVDGLDLSEAEVDTLAFVGTRGDGASFRGVTANGLRIVGDCSFRRADFSDAKLVGASLRGTDIEGSSFDRSDLSGADISECRAADATFRRAVMTGALLVRTDLSRADLSECKLLDAIAHKANLSGAKLEGANLFQADLAGAHGDKATSLARANTGRVRQTRSKL